MKKYLFIFIFVIGFIFIPNNVFAYDGYATVARGKYFYAGQSTTYNTDWYSLLNNSPNNKTLSFPSGYTYFINGADYVAAINFNGEQSFSGSVQIPVVVQASGGVNDPSLINQSAFHIGISSNFGEFNLTPNVTTFDKTCSTAIQQGQTPIVYTYCTYFIEFNFVTSSPVYGSQNFNFGLQGSGNSAVVLSTQDNVFSVSFPLNFWSSSLGLNPNYYLVDNSQSGGGNSSTDLSNIENSLDNVNDKLDDVNDNLDNVNDKLDDMNTNQQATTNAIDDMNDNLIDDTGVSDSDISDFFTNFHSSESRPLRDLLFLLIKPFELLVEHSSDSCSPYSFGSLYGSNLSLPCINLESYLGSSLYDIIDYLCSFMLLYGLFTFVARSFHGMLNLNDIFNDYLYDHIGGR